MKQMKQKIYIQREKSQEIIDALRFLKRSYKNGN